MFYYLEGNITVIDGASAVLDASGVGFLCHVTTNTLSRLENGKRAKLYTYCNIKEDAFDIYGFYDIREKRCFELLLSVSGVGPKGALSILSSVTPENLALAIATENDKALTAAPGIGKRIAQRIILELKDKLAAGDIADTSAPLELPAAQNDLSSAAGEAAEALLVLGYSRQEIAAAMRKINTEGLTVEEIIREVLKTSLK